jgi:uncharacterized protein (TIGR02246 family)
MKHRALPIAALLLAWITACAHRPPVPSEAERERLQQREIEFLTALSARDLERTAAHFADDAVLHVAGMPTIQGREAIRRFYENVFRFLIESAAMPGTRSLSASADMAYSLGTVRNVFTRGQERSEHAGKYLLVWERRDDQWSIAVYAVSSDRTEAE